LNTKFKSSLEKRKRDVEDSEDDEEFDEDEFSEVLVKSRRQFEKDNRERKSGGQGSFGAG